jgi:hypothetical protein
MAKPKKGSKKANKASKGVTKVHEKIADTRVWVERRKASTMPLPIPMRELIDEQMKRREAESKKPVSFFSHNAF